MNFSLYILLPFYLLNAKQETTKFEIFKSELKKTPQRGHIVKVQNEFFTLTKPVISDSSKQRIIDGIISKEIKENYCGGKGCEVNFAFKLSHNSKRLISFKETVYTMFRQPIDVKTTTFFNYMILGHDVYEVNLNLTTDLKARLKRKLKSARNAECNELLNDNTLINLYVKDRSVYVDLYNDEICNTIIKFDFMNADLVFKKVSSFSP